MTRLITKFWIGWNVLDSSGDYISIETLVKGSLPWGVSKIKIEIAEKGWLFFFRSNLSISRLVVGKLEGQTLLKGRGCFDGGNEQWQASYPA